MGFQLPGPTRGKVDHLIATYDAERVPRPSAVFHDIPESRALICVVDSVTYETASFCFSAAEMALHNDSSDFRRRTWLVMDRGKAEELSTDTVWPARAAGGRNSRETAPPAETRATSIPSMFRSWVGAG